MKTAEDLLADYIEIYSPQRLIDVSESLKDFISQGLIREVKGNCSVMDILKNMPFPEDFISIEFETVPGRTKYILSCETYHGRGGVFKRLDS